MADKLDIREAVWQYVGTIGLKLDSGKALGLLAYVNGIGCPRELEGALSLFRPVVARMASQLVGKGYAV